MTLQRKKAVLYKLTFGTNLGNISNII